MNLNQHGYMMAAAITLEIGIQHGSSLSPAWARPSPPTATRGRPDHAGIHTTTARAAGDARHRVAQPAKMKSPASGPISGSLADSSVDGVSDCALVMF